MSRKLSSIRYRHIIRLLTLIIKISHSPVSVNICWLLFLLVVSLSRSICNNIHRHSNANLNMRGSFPNAWRRARSTGAQFLFAVPSTTRRGHGRKNGQRATHMALSDPTKSILVDQAAMLKGVALSQNGFSPTRTAACGHQRHIRPLTGYNILPTPRCRRKNRRPQAG